MLLFVSLSLIRTLSDSCKQSRLSKKRLRVLELEPKWNRLLSSKRSYILVFHISNFLTCRFVGCWIKEYCNLSIPFLCSGNCGCRNWQEPGDEANGATAHRRVHVGWRPLHQGTVHCGGHSRSTIRSRRLYHVGCAEASCFILCIRH